MDEKTLRDKIAIQAMAALIMKDDGELGFTVIDPICRAAYDFADVMLQVRSGADVEGEFDVEGAEMMARALAGRTH